MKFALTFCFLFSVMAMNAQHSLTGVWDTGQDNTKVKITESNNIFAGTIISSDRSDARIGKLLIKDLKQQNGIWKGKVYAAKKGKWYDATVKEKGNALLISVKVGLVSKTLEWTKE